jgi:AcrR family transcriptional regulator
LDDVVGYVRAEGLGDLSLRQLAEAIGTSHRMLLYHFGSREGLLAALVDQIEAEERTATAPLLRDLTDEVGTFRTIWNRLRAPKRAAEERLFFELAAMAAQRRPGTENFAENFVAPWLVVVAAAGGDPVQTRLDVATLRGLLLDLLVTGDRKAVDRAFERYLAQRLRSSS